MLLLHLLPLSSTIAWKSGVALELQPFTEDTEALKI